MTLAPTRRVGIGSFVHYDCTPVFLVSLMRGGFAAALRVEPEQGGILLRDVAHRDIVTRCDELSPLLGVPSLMRARVCSPRLVEAVR